MVRSTAVMAYLKSIAANSSPAITPTPTNSRSTSSPRWLPTRPSSISTRTGEALAAYKAGHRVSKRIRALYPDGVPAEIIAATAGKLGAELPQCRNLRGDAQKLGTVAAAAERSRQAREAYRHLEPTMSQFRADGLSLEAIAARLNELGHRTRNGCAWNPGQVRRVLGRIRPA